MDHILDYLVKTAERIPDKTAVDDGNVRMTWEELLNASRRIGTAVARRTTPGKPVVIINEKSALTLAAMFGAVFAGCFYTVIDPVQPSGRVREIFRVLEPETVLTGSGSRDMPDSISFSGARIDLTEALAEGPDEALLNDIRKRTGDTDLLYCMFTSGSTGSPKGIVVSHRAVIDFISHFISIFNIKETNRIANQAPFDFDVSVKDIYSCVFTGAELILIPQKLFSTPPLLLDFICDKKADTLIWAVSALTLVSGLKGLKYRVPADAKKIMFSGEVMPVKQLRIWQEALPETEFVNLYGPTEITCNCTYYRIPGIVSEETRIPVGKPFPGREVFLTDEDGKVLEKPGETGEICVAGESLSEGYYHNPEETEKRFLTDPDGRRFYKTGDLGCRGDDGELYFSGRKDFQVKIMGRRIELEEVEHVIDTLPGVEKSCCTVNKKRNQLTAFYCGEAKEKDLRAGMKERLPFYMIPQKIKKIGQMPLTKNGKIDRKALNERQGDL